MDDSTIVCDKVTNSYEEEVKTIPSSFNEKKVTCKMKKFYALLVFLLITIALLIAVSIYFYLIKYLTKNLFPFHYAKLKQFCIDSIN